MCSICAGQHLKEYLIFRAKSTLIFLIILNFKSSNKYYLLRYPKNHLHNFKTRVAYLLRYICGIVFLALHICEHFLLSAKRKKGIFYTKLCSKNFVNIYKIIGWSLSQVSEVLDSLTVFSGTLPEEETETLRQLGRKHVLTLWMLDWSCHDLPLFTGWTL
jgi:hypothetical protein